VFAPFRTLLLRRGAPLALIAAAASVSFLFGATPFLVPEIADRYGVAVGTAGLISAFQVFGFAASTFLASRALRPSRSVLVGAALAGAALDLLSAAIEVFPVLLALRLLAGVAAGLLTWLAWADAMRAPRSMRAIASVGPVTVLVGAPLLAWIGTLGGDRAIFLAVAVVAAVPALVPVEIESRTRPARDRISPSRSNVVLLAALGVLTLSGSVTFIYLGAFAQDRVGLGEVAVSLGFSAHSLAGLVGARLSHRFRTAWPFLAGTAASVALIAAVEEPVAYAIGMVAWGACFWLAVPRVLSHIADWSFLPDERVGDAQGIMALGRAIGPVFGSLLIGAGRYAGAAIFTVVGLSTSATLVGAVERYRSGRDGPHSSAIDHLGALEDGGGTKGTQIGE
jgi:predicted MFS family arabinose efflux permease